MPSSGAITLKVGMMMVSAASAVSLALMFLHPDQTPQRLLINHWPWFVVVMLSAAAGAYLIVSADPTGPRQ